jgi:hypothetical protein
VLPGYFWKDDSASETMASHRIWRSPTGEILALMEELSPVAFLLPKYGKNSS